MAIRVAEERAPALLNSTIARFTPGVTPKSSALIISRFTWNECIKHTFHPMVTTASHLSGSSWIPVWWSGIMLVAELSMVVEGFKFAVGIGIGCVLLLLPRL